MLNKLQKLILGIITLLIVDIIWVLSSELTKYLYENEKFDKPFFCTYLKTSMFALYLVVIGMIAPWKEACDRTINYAMMDSSQEDDNYFSNHNSLSDSTFVPIRVINNEAVSGTESDDSSIRSVRFSKMAEVREMSVHEASEALMSRLSYSASLRMRRQKTHHKTARTALLFSVLWFIASYLFQLSLDYSEPAFVTLLSSTSSFFTLILASIFPSATGDKFTVSKLLSVLVNIFGVITVTISDISDAKFSKGVVLALLSAFTYASYLIFVKRKNDTEEKIDIPLFFGFVGLWNLLLLWPIFFILHFLQLETFELPNHRQLGVLFLNGIIGTAVSEVLWLCGCFLTSSLFGTLAISLQIPLSILFDVVLRGENYSIFFYIGSVPIFLSLFFLAILVKNDDSDPLMNFIKLICRKLCKCRRVGVVRITDEEQQESLIDSHEN